MDGYQLRLNYDSTPAWAAGPAMPDPVLSEVLLREAAATIDARVASLEDARRVTPEIMRLEFTI